MTDPHADPVALFERAAAGAGLVMANITRAHLGRPTPCSEWNVQQLVDHLVGGPRYLLAAVAGTTPEPASGTTVDEYRTTLAACLRALHDPPALTRRCASPLGFEWTVAEAAAGTFMDTLIHTWDLASATGQATDLDAELVDQCIAMFLPEMPERGRAGGIVGPAVAVGPGASAQDRLLGAMGRRP